MRVPLDGLQAVEVSEEGGARREGRAEASNEVHVLHGRGEIDRHTHVSCMGLGERGWRLAREGEEEGLRWMGSELRETG